jgi:hypothetical protein
MNSFLNIILVGDWEEYHRKGFVSAVANRIEEWSDTLLIHSPLSLLIHPIIKFKKRFLPHLKGYYKPKILKNNIHIYTPVILFHYNLWLKFPFLAYFDSVIMKFQIKRYIKRNYNSMKTVLWVTIPGQIYFSKVFNTDYLVYDTFDDNELSYSGEKMDKAYKFNRELIRKADMTICLARYTYNKYFLESPNAVYIPNANSYSLYKKNENKNESTELDSIKEPIIGYLGNIRNWIDFELIKYILDNYKGIKLVFIGMVLRSAINDMKILKEYNNFIHIDFINVKKIPSYMKCFDVGIIPFKVNNFTSSVFPNKFFEYMASEIPIVTTALPELNEYSKYVGFAKSKEDFLKFCKSAINGEYDNLIKSYKDLASKNDWSDRADTVNNYLKKFFNI